MSFRIRALLHILLNRAVHVAVFELACRTWGPSIKDRAAICIPSSPACISAYNPGIADRSEEHTSELQSLMRISYAVFCLKKKTTKHKDIDITYNTQTNTMHNSDILFIYD